MLRFGLLAAVLACGGAASPAATAVPPAAAADSAPWLLYVTNQGAARVTIIDMRTNEVAAVVDLQALGFSANAKPHHVAVEPDGSFWYVTLIGDHKILKFTRDNRLVAQADFETPGMLALDPAADQLFVGRSMTAVNPPKRIGIIRRSDFSIDEVEILFPRPHAMASPPQGGWAYAASLVENSIAAVNGRTAEVTLTTLPGAPKSLVQFAIAPDGRTMVVGGELSGDFMVFDISAPPAIRPVASIPVGGKPWAPVFTPDGRRVYIGNFAANTVTVVDMTTRTVAAVIRGDGLAQPDGSAVSPDGRYVYFANRNQGGEHVGHRMDGPHAEHGTVVVIDTRTDRIVKVLEVAALPTGVGTAPLPARP